MKGKIVLLPPYVEPEHRHLVENAQMALNEYEQHLLERIKAELFNHKCLEPSQANIEEAEKQFHEDPMRMYLITKLANIKSICEKPRFMVKSCNPERKE